jgi:hypothetical protein
VSTVTLSQRNVVAAFRDLELADAALRDLREAGFRDDELSLLGRPIEEVQEDLEEGTGPGEPIGGDIIKHTFAGGAAGGAAGGVVGALGAAAVAAIPGVGLVAGTGALIGFVSGAFAGSTVGSIVEGEAALRTSHSWRQALDAIQEGAVILGIHGSGHDRIREAFELLQGHDPMDLRIVDERGETLDPEA